MGFNSVFKGLSRNMLNNLDNKKAGNKLWLTNIINLVSFALEHRGIPHFKNELTSSKTKLFSSKGNFLSSKNPRLQYHAHKSPPMNPTSQPYGPGIESRWGQVGKILRTRPERPWGPPSLLHSEYRIISGGKTAEA